MGFGTTPRDQKQRNDDPAAMVLTSLAAATGPIPDCDFEQGLKNISALSDQLYGSLNTDRQRFHREFFSVEPPSISGNYYPRYQVTGTSETGTSHVSYLGRPYFSYKVPSCYGFSKYALLNQGIWISGSSQCENFEGEINNQQRMRRSQVPEGCYVKPL